MASRVWASAAATLVVAELFGVSARATADSVEPLKIGLTVLNHAQVPERILSHAKAECARIYRALGVTLIWSDAIDSSVPPHMSVNVVSKPFGTGPAVPDSLAVKAADSRVLGVAPGHKERRDLAVWAFYERIEDTATLFWSRFGAAARTRHGARDRPRAPPVRLSFADRSNARRLG
jgi:hypothetical protein